MKIPRIALAPARRAARLVTTAALGLSLAGGLAIAGVAGPAAASSGSTLRVEADTSISTFNPFLAYFNGELNVLGNIYPTLTTINQQGLAAPYLASSCTTSADKLTWTFTLTSGLKWSDALPVPATNPAPTLNLLLKNSTP